MRNILLTGDPGVGKTTLIQKVVQDLSGNAGGFYTKEIRENSRRIGFEIVTFSGRRGILASTKIRSPLNVGSRDEKQKCICGRNQETSGCSSNRGD